MNDLQNNLAACFLATTRMAWQRIPSMDVKGEVIGHDGVVAEAMTGDDAHLLQTGDAYVA